MDSRDLLIGILFLSQTTVGILGNFSLLSHYLVLYYRDSSLRATDVILTHLTVANSLIILLKGVPHTMAAFGLKLFSNALVCKFFLYVQRVGRSMSIATTCLLSVFQAITISPGNSGCKDLKVKAPRYIHLFIPLCWTLYTLVNSVFPIYVSNVKSKSNNMTKMREYGYCSVGDYDGIMDSLYAALVVFPEVVFSVLILWSSGSMVVTLYRHKQRVQHIRSTNVSSRASPENRATQSILVLVSTFVTFYTLSSILNGILTRLNNPSWWFKQTNSIISMCFPSFVPFILQCFQGLLQQYKK